MRRKHGAADFGSGIVDEDAMPVNEIDLRPLVEEIGDVGERSRQQRVVAVQVGHDVAIDALEAPVDGIRLPAVCLASPGNSFAIAPEDIDRFVGGSAVLHMVEQSRIILAEYAVDGGPQEAAMIK